MLSRDDHLALTVAVEGHYWPLHYRPVPYSAVVHTSIWLDLFCFGNLTTSAAYSINMAIVQLLVVLSLASTTLADSFGGWQNGRATHYGTDAWSIHKGSCGYGWLDRGVATGWDVAAISDRAPDYGGSCGKCKEVKCRPSSFSDGYGQWLDRTNTCYNNYASVVVMVTDTCPCVFPDNYASNKRWCCGDMYHLDMSVWAYEKLGSKLWGVLGVSWRDVPCWYKPKSQAKVPSWTKPTPKPWWEKAPAGWTKSMDRRLHGARPMFQSTGKH